MKRYGFWIFLLVVAGLVGWGLLRNPGEKPLAVFAGKAQRMAFVREVSGDGSVVGEVLRLAFAQSGRVAEVYVQEGDHVRAGDTLARLENLDLTQRITQTADRLRAANADVKRISANYRQRRADLQARLAEARDKLDLTKELVRVGAASISELRRAETAVRNLELQISSLQSTQTAERANAEARLRELQDTLDSLRRDLAATSLKAPVDGVVLQVPFNSGEIPAAPIRLLVAGTLTPEAYFTESEGAELKPGQEARIELEAGSEKPLKSRVKRVLPPESSAGSVRIPVRFDLLDPDVARPGYSLTAYVVVNRIEDAVVVPLDALVETESSTYIWLAKNDKAEKREVKVLDRNPLVAAVSGVKPGDTVLRLPPDDLKEGAALSVTIKEESPE